MVNETDKTKKNSHRKKTKGQNSTQEEKLTKKRDEAGRVIQKKLEILTSNKLSYLEYLELQEEICRLSSFREGIKQKILDLNV